MFYSAYIPAYLLILFAVIIIDYYAGILIERSQDQRRRNFLVLSILANVGILAVFKYYNFTVDNVARILGLFGVIALSLPHFGWPLPIGLSFHTFQSMSYTIEIYAARQKCERNFLTYALYVLFFPQLVAGPIERPQQMLPQFYEKKQFSRESAVRGLQLMLWGFFKKIVIADRIAPLVDQVYASHGEYSGLTLFIATALFTFQLYCDFSGYSDIAIGSAEVLGFNLMTNFDRPFLATNIIELWRRWHISLTSWLRDYAFYPLYFKTKRVFSATMVLFLLSGLWHGANWTFVIWGALHGAAIVAMLLWNKRFPPKLLSEQSVVFKLAGAVATFVFVSLTEVFFRSTDVSTAFSIMNRILQVPFFLIGRFSLTVTEIEWLRASQLDLFWCVFFIVVLMVCELLQDRWSLRAHPGKYPKVVRWSIYYVVLAAVLLLGKFDSEPFLYFQF
ncbi:MAG: hypothetical protein K2W95_11850 [Candidatus Obscuribacterales bacterium]|nr:hypothetical protein [Candidatus Obscuribacterales bacterium]